METVDPHWKRLGEVDQSPDKLKIVLEALTTKLIWFTNQGWRCHSLTISPLPGLEQQ